MNGIGKAWRTLKTSTYKRYDTGTLNCVFSSGNVLAGMISWGPGSMWASLTVWSLVALMELTDFGFLTWPLMTLPHTAFPFCTFLPSESDRRVSRRQTYRLPLPRDDPLRGEALNLQEQRGTCCKPCPRVQWLSPLKLFQSSFSCTDKGLWSGCRLLPSNNLPSPV